MVGAIKRRFEMRKIFLQYFTPVGIWAITWGSLTKCPFDVCNWRVSKMSRNIVFCPRNVVSYPRNIVFW